MVGRVTVDHGGDVPPYRQLAVILKAKIDSGEIAPLYANAGPRVLPRDLNKLLKLGLIRRAGRGYRTRSGIVQAFLPPMATVEA
jgi:hypothetical protein